MRGREMDNLIRERFGEEMLRKVKANDLTERERANVAALFYGYAYLVNGKYVPPDGVEIVSSELEASK